MCLFAGFGFTGSRLVWDPFSEFTTKWGHSNFRLSLNFHGWFSTLYFCTSSSSRRLTSTKCRWEKHPFSAGSTPAQKIWEFCFFSSHFLITVVIHPWRADLQPVLNPESLKGHLAVPFDSMSAFSSFFLISLLHQKLVFVFITWTYHITLHRFSCSIISKARSVAWLRASSLWEGNTEFKPSVICWTFDLALHHAHSEGVT